ncbi:hypothetical protein AAU61_14380 [Desulfocarbo indianensis]|nr:hypothetical protein AAU61_14380 [Desulfocarbo indianensis]
MAGQDYIGLPKGDDKELSEPERATLEQALEVLRASGEPGGGYAKALYQNIQMFHRGLRDAKAAAQNPSSGAGAVGSSRGGRKRRSGAGS